MQLGFTCSGYKYFLRYLHIASGSGRITKIIYFPRPATMFRNIFSPFKVAGMTLFYILAYQHRVSALAKLSADKRAMLVDVALVVRSQERAFITCRIIGSFNHLR